MVSRTKKTARVLAVVLVALVVAGAVANEERPRTGTTGQKAERLTRLLEDETGVAGFEATKALSFRFMTGTRYLWDREREYVRIRFRGTEVQLPLRGGRGVFLDGGQPVTDHAARVALRDRAYRMFVNDSFWLHPFAAMRAPGVTRSVIDRDGREALLVEYASGGVTPGDAYVYEPAHGEEPIRWAMFVSVLPIGGVALTWEGWVELPTGARIATRHGNGLVAVTMFTEVRGARTMRELVGADDPFRELEAANPRR